MSSASWSRRPCSPWSGRAGTRPRPRAGLPGALTLAGLITLFQSSSEDSHRGRVFGALTALEGISVLAGTLGAGYLSKFAGIVPVLAIQGGGYVVAGLVMLVHLRDGRLMDTEPSALRQPPLATAR